MEIPLKTLSILAFGKIPLLNFLILVMLYEIRHDFEKAEYLNNDISVGNSISIIADQHAIEHFFKIKYVRWAGVLWTVTSVEVQSPRLILSLGSVYNGPTT